MTSEQSPTSQTRHGRGIFECPKSDCHEAILGSYGDLLDHLDGDHYLWARAVIRDGHSVREAVKAAQREALSADIQEQMVVCHD